MRRHSQMKDDPKAADRTQQSAEHQAEANHGEGNPEAAAHFNKAEHEFVASKRGQQKIREAGNVSPAEQGELEEAERVTRSPPINATPKVVPPKAGQR